MGRNTAIVGKSGTGKSTSYGQIPEIGMVGLNPAETVVINVANKPLPFKGWAKKYNRDLAISNGGNYIETSDYDKISKIIEYVSKSRLEIKSIVIDDAQYILAFEFMSRAKESGYAKYADFGSHIYKIIKTGLESRSDLNLFYLWHPDEGDNMKLKTVGKMIDDYIALEGIFTTILYTRVSKSDSKIKYEFVTNNDGAYPAKSPVGMFDSLYITNDLGIVKDCMAKYDND